MTSTGTSYGAAPQAVAPVLRTVLNEFQTRLLAHYGSRVVSVTLFGSYARGDARADSDVDVLVVLSEIASHQERTWPMELAGELTVEYPLVICPIVLSSADLALLKTREDLLVQNIEREGIVL